MGIFEKLSFLCNEIIVITLLFNKKGIIVYGECGFSKENIC